MHMWVLLFTVPSASLLFMKIKLYSNFETYRYIFAKWSGAHLTMSCFVEKFWLLSRTRQNHELHNGDSFGKTFSDQLNCLSEHKFNVTIESLKEAQKRKTDSGQDERKVKRRSNGLDVVQFLKERAGNENILKDQELELKRQQLSREGKNKSWKKEGIVI